MHTAGAAAGWFAYALSPTYRARLRANLAQAGLDDAATRRAAIAEAGKQAIESAWVWLRPARDLLAKVDPADLERMKAAQTAGRPVVFLTPHLGCFEIISKTYALHADPRTRTMTVLYRTPRKPALRPLMEAGRAVDGLVLAPADMRGVRLLMRAMKTGQAAGILPDQVPSQGEGVWAPFFGRPAYTMTLPARLAVAGGANVVFVYGERLPRGRGYRIHVAPLLQPLTGDAAHDAAVLNRALEQLIRACPAQYLWGYNRYKVPAGAAPAEAAP
ncbi:MAG: lysophospholipid acyltransferase family protein [Burkholderiaceae bacterium]